jgi:TolB-like protein/Tfp pilus assembly protein PilF
MNETQRVESKAKQPVCAQCGSRLSSTDGTETRCVSCLLHVALGEEDLNDAGQAYRFDQYELITDDAGNPVELGRGAMGVTYKAFDTNLRCEVALKVIHPRFLADESSRARFLSEARAAAQLRHRNIASVFHLGSEHGEYFYTMELVEGETIENRVRRKGPIDCATALDIALQVTRALIAAGHRKFVHRDVKPSNIMLCTEADGAVVAKLIDFGLVRGITEKFAPATASPVRQIGDRPNPSSRTAGGSNEVARRPVRTGFIGTPHYASPEQFAGERTDARSDIYSLGVTLWFMLSGKLPFDGARAEIQREQLSALPLDQLKGTPRTVVDLIGRMLDVDPTKRPESPAALKDQLNKCIAAIDVAKQKQRRRFAYSAIVAVTLLIAALGASYILQHKPSPGAPTDIVPEKSIAVLPFANLIRESDSAYIVDGVRAQIVARLAKIANLKVVSGSPTQRYQSTPDNPGQVAAELGVANILEGSVEKHEEKFRVAVRLIDAKNGAELWRQSYERAFAEIIQVESEVARHAAGGLGVSLTESEKQAISKAATSNPHSYEAYLKGRYVWLQRNLDSYRQAREYFEQAIALDPNNAPAYAGLSDAYQFLGAFILPDRKENYDKAKSAYKRALELDPTLAEAHASAGLIAMNYDWDWPLAEQEFRRALALDPNEAIFYDWYAEYLMAVGKTNESIGSIERARELDPFSTIINSDVGKLLFLARHYDQAEAQLKETLRMDPDFSQPHWWLGAVYLMKHRFDQAIAQFKIDDISGERGLIAYAYGMAGRKAEARQMLEATKKLIAQRGDFDKWSLTCAYIGVGDKDQAIASLEQDCENHATTVVSLKSNPLYDPLRSEPRFIDLMRRVNLTPVGIAESEIVPEKSIAVLPFENLSDDKDSAYIADGIQDEILTRLSKIADLKVISRTSTQHYKSAPENLQEIGRQLGVANILEGGVQRSGDVVRVNVQLIKVATDSHLWADTFDGKLTDIFSVESEIAKATADQLQAKLTTPEGQVIAAKESDNPKAYDAYLRALAYTLRTSATQANCLSAQRYLREAVRLDPHFALAWALLSYVDADGYITSMLQPTVALREEARQAADTAIALKPHLGEALVAEGQYHYACLKDYDTAIRYFEQARPFLPNNSQVPQLLAYVTRRRGQWDRSEAYFNEAERLDPRNVSILAQHALSYVHLRRFPEALRKLDQVLDIIPDDLDTLVSEANIAQAQGDLPRAAALLAPLHTGTDNTDALETQVYQTILERRPGAIIPRLNEILAKPDPALGYFNGELRFWLGWAQEVAGDHVAAQKIWRQARSELEPFLEEQPENHLLLGYLALTNMGLGDKKTSLALSERAMALIPIEKDASSGPAPIEIFARVAAQTGEADRAIATLQKLLSIPYEAPLASNPPLTPALLRLDPMFDPLRNDPRFQKLLASLTPK